MSLEFEPLLTEAISLEDNDINRAVEISSHISNDSHQWETYLNGLSLCIFEKWLDERDDILTISTGKSNFKKPSLTNLIPNFTNLQVGDFKICLITISSLFDKQIPLSKIVVDVPEFVPHFYVLVEVLEERECGIVRGFISYYNLRDNLRDNSGNRFTKSTVNTTKNTTEKYYQIPLDCFDNNPNNLLLYLRALDPNTISLPAIPTDRKERLVAMEKELVTSIPKIIPQLQDPDTEISEVFSPKQLEAIITNSELAEWVYKLQLDQLQTDNQTNNQTDNESINKYSKYLQDLIKLTTQPAINIGRWLTDEIDEIGQQLSWTLLPSLIPATTFRSPLEEFDTIKTQLETQGIEIPIVARCGYNDFSLAGTPLRLYAITWNSSTQNEPLSWSLMLILGAPVPNTIPDNLQLRVSDQTGILVEQKVNPQQVDSYLFTSVMGEWDEKFLVTASLGDNISFTLPPFSFDQKIGSQAPWF